jgi:hypothetical protein
MDMDGHHQHQPHHQGHERNQSHDQQNHDHSHGTDLEGRNEAEALDEVLSIFIVIVIYNADNVIPSVFFACFFFFHRPLVYVKKLMGNSNSNHQRGPVS